MITSHETFTLSCDGEDTHPKIYLMIDEKKGSAICPYCNKVFYKENEDESN